MAKKYKISSLDELPGGFLESYNLHTQLIEACDWDEDRAVELVKEGLDIYINLYEYAQYDSSLIQNNEDFERLLKANFTTNITTTQFKALG